MLTVEEFTALVVYATGILDQYYREHGLPRELNPSEALVLGIIYGKEQIDKSYILADHIKAKIAEQA